MTVQEYDKMMEEKGTPKVWMVSYAFTCPGIMDGEEESVSEILLGLDMNNSTTASTPTAYYCKIKGRICEYATDFGWCCYTACMKRDKEQED